MVSHNPDWRSANDEKELVKRKRAQQKANRVFSLKVARQKDSKLVDRLKKSWAEADAKAKQDIQRRTFEYICMLCNRPFTLPRKLNDKQIKRCPACRAFWRRKQLRETYARHREKRLEYQRQYGAARRQPKPEPKPEPETKETPAYEEPKIPTNLPPWFYNNYGR